MSIRNATTNDCSEIANIYNQYVALENYTMESKQWTAGLVMRIFEKLTPREAFFVFQDDDKSPILGWASIKRYSPRQGYRTSCETSVYLDFEARGRSIGKKLMEALFDHAQIHGYHHLVAKIFTENVQSVDFHHYLGFETVGIQKEVGFTGGRWKDVTILQKLIPIDTESLSFPT